MVIWHAVLDDGSKKNGCTCNGSWKTLGETLGSRKIVKLFIDNEMGAGKIDDNKDGYFICNKIIGSLANGNQMKLAGIGYWQKSDNTARIKWYNAKSMELFSTEARTPESCGLSLIKNPE